MKIYVGNLSYTCTEEDLKREFEVYGAVTSVTLIKDRETNKPRGFGFIEMADEDGKKAIDTMNGKDVMGRNLVVNEARPKESRGNDGPRRDNFRRGR
ncbi:TPA: RNA-binding protein [candidate division WOR-3 bacterium]|jgi:RNA recognition motif-containing protein|uniref:RNA-binding protein n=1 Tax=candidate division WOR-3 bacterium TaxID=2052148 RepID=A0A350H8I3_UNCW3|nr:RNA-binding protein [candidate division WOR-3 bacterium]